MPGQPVVCACPCQKRISLRRPMVGGMPTPVVSASHQWLPLILVISVWPCMLTADQEPRWCHRLQDGRSGRGRSWWCQTSAAGLSPGSKLGHANRCYWSSTSYSHAQAGTSGRCRFWWCCTAAAAAAMTSCPPSSTSPTTMGDCTTKTTTFSHRSRTARERVALL